MKIFLVLMMAAQASYSLAADLTRFDGQYKLVKATGTSIYNRVTDCSAPVQIGPNTLDARNTECSFKKVKQDPATQCGQVFFVRGIENVIRSSVYSDPANDGVYGASPVFVDRNSHTTACDTLNYFVCLAIKHTDFYDESINVSRANFASNYKQDGYNKEYLSFQKTADGLIVGVKKTKYWASGKTHPDLMETADVKCTYAKVAP